VVAVLSEEATKEKAIEPIKWRGVTMRMLREDLPALPQWTEPKPACWDIDYALSIMDWGESSVAGALGCHRCLLTCVCVCMWALQITSLTISTRGASSE
jgi:hypothetical protein